MFVFWRKRPMELETSSDVANHSDSNPDTANNWLKPIPTKPAIKLI